jgi:hypothetical protein
VGGPRPEELTGRSQGATGADVVVTGADDVLVVVLGVEVSLDDDDEDEDEVGGGSDSVGAAGSAVVVAAAPPPSGSVTGSSPTLPTAWSAPLTPDAFPFPTAAPVTTLPSRWAPFPAFATA